MSFAILSILFVADLAYGIVRTSKRYPTYGIRGRAIEAVIIGIIVGLWTFVVAPWAHGWDVDAAIEFLHIVTLWFLPAALVVYIGAKIRGRGFFPPVAVGGVVSIIALIVLMIPGFVFLDVFVPGFRDYSTAMGYLFMGIFVLLYSIGAFVAAEFNDGERAGEGDIDSPQNTRDPLGPTSEWSWDEEEYVEPTPHGQPSPYADANASRNTATEVDDTDTDLSEFGIDAEELHRVQQAQRAEWVASKNYAYDWQYSELGFGDIGGYYDVKNALYSEVLEPLQAEQKGDDRFSRFGIEPERGILLYGPPGTGKTMFARALAGELDVPFVELSPADVTSMWVNESSEQVKTLFKEAQDLGQCVIFLDEAEHLFGGRDHTAKSAHAEDRKVTSEFLAQLTRDSREAIVVAATNRPDDIDRAILRPGRLTTHFEVGLPDEEARHAIFGVHLENVPSSLSGDEYAELATHTEGLTGAELVSLVTGARRSAASRNADGVTREDFPPAEELKELAANLNTETGDLPDIDDDEGNALNEREVDAAARSGGESDAADSDDSDDRTIGYQ